MKGICVCVHDGCVGGGREEGIFVGFKRGEGRKGA